MLQLDEKPDTSLETYKGSWKNYRMTVSGQWLLSKNGPWATEMEAHKAAESFSLRYMDKGPLKEWAYEGGTVRAKDLTNIHMQIPVGDA